MEPGHGVEAHYAGGSDGARRILDSIEQGLAAMGTSLSDAGPADLAPVEEFHIGGRPATVELCRQLGVEGSAQVLDVGAGIGGTARFVASTFGAHVTGIDLTPEYVEVATELSWAVGLQERTGFEQGSATALPFGCDTFDFATQLHVGMNIDDKEALFAEVHRVLRPGGRFGVYDVMRRGDGEFSFPVPWAADPSMSFVDTPDAYRAAAEAAGFELVGERDRSSFAADFFAALRKQGASSGGPPPLGLHLLMGPETPAKVQNMVDAVLAGTLAPIEQIWQRPTP